MYYSHVLRSTFRRGRWRRKGLQSLYDVTELDGYRWLTNVPKWIMDR